MYTIRTILLLFVFVALNVTPTHGFSVNLKNICRFGSFCNYIVNGIRKTVYGLYNFNKEKPNYCLQKRIEECTCFEMLILDKSWIPNWPKLDEVDVNRLRTQTSKIYHPDPLKLNKDYEGPINEPFMFLEKCSIWFKYPQIRKDYRSRLEAPLKALVGLGTTEAMEPIARGIIYEINNQFESSYVDPPPPSNSSQNAEEQTFETLHIFLDNKDTMSGESLEKGKRIFDKLKHRIFATQTNIHLIDSNKQHKIVDAAFTLNESNINESVYDKWDANKGASGGYQYYLWEYIWFEMKDKKNTDCEIIIMTDGYNKYRTGGSHSSFQGIEGITKLMNALKANGDALCKPFVYCLSDDSSCKKEVGKSFRDLTIPAGGFPCDSSNFDDCTAILTSSHAERAGFANDFKSEHVRQVDDGKVKRLDYFDYKNEL